MISSQELDKLGPGLIRDVDDEFAYERLRYMDDTGDFGTFENLENWVLAQLLVADRKARLGKRKTRDEHIFEVNGFERICDLAKDIVGQTYRPRPSMCLIADKPVIREIFAAKYDDRLIHQLVVSCTMPYIDRRLMYDSYSCRKGKGTSFGVRRMQEFMRKVSMNGTQETWVAKLDIQGFFMSIQRNLLFQNIQRWLEKAFPNNGLIFRMLLFLWHQIIFDDPLCGVDDRRDRTLMKKLPNSKSLFHQPLGQGLVIGNCTSQNAANIFLDPIDRLLKIVMRYKCMGRYVDDISFVLSWSQKEQWKRDLIVIREALEASGLTLHPNKVVLQRMEHGLEFLGIRIFYDHLELASRPKASLNTTANEVAMGLRDVASLQSLLGFSGGANCIPLEKEIFDRLGWDYFY